MNLLSRSFHIARTRAPWLWTAAFVTGAASAGSLHALGGLSFWLMVPALMILLIFFLRGMPRGFLLAALFCGFLVGALRHHAFDMDLDRSERLLGREGEHLRVLFRVDEPVERHSDYTVLWGRVTHVLSGGTWQLSGGRARMAVGGPVPDVMKGDLVAAVASAGRPRNFGNPCGFDYVSYLARKGVAARLWVKSEDRLARVHDGFSFSRHVELIRQSIIKELRSVGTYGGPLLSALSMGDRDGLPSEVLSSFEELGLAHLLAISGLHLGLVAAVFYLAAAWVFRRIAFLSARVASQKSAAFLTVPVVVVYAVMTGLRVPTQRALIMVLAYLLAVMVDRRHELWNTLGLAACVILFIWPAALLELSFQMSFAAVAGIVYGVPRLTAAARGEKSAAEEELDRLEYSLGRRRSFFRVTAAKYFLGLLAVSAIAHWAVMPFMLRYFHSANPLGPLYNVFAVPFTGFVLIPCGLLAAAATFISPGPGEWILAAAGFPAEMFSRVMILFREQARTQILLPPFSAAGVAAWYLGGALFLESAVLLRRRQWFWKLKNPAARRFDMLGHGRKAEHRFPRTLSLAGVVFSLILTGIGGAGPALRRPALPDRATTVAAVSVGQGQSLLVRTPDDKTMLVDGGGFYMSSFDTGKGIVAPCLLCLGIRSLDAVVMSHGHPDHGKGLYYVLNRFPVGELWMPPDDNEIGRELMKIADRRGIRVRLLDESAGSFAFGSNTVRVLHPPQDPDALSGDLNNRSLVLRIDTGDGRVLLTGDVEKEAETMLVQKYGPAGVVEPGALEADVMSVPHHGSRSSSTPDFIEAVSPGSALVSAAGYDVTYLPAPDICQRYSSRGIELVRTDASGFCGIILQENRARAFRRTDPETLHQGRNRWRLHCR